MALDGMQRVLVDELERDGYSTTEAHELLDDLLDQMRTRADEIAKDVRRD